MFYFENGTMDETNDVKSFQRTLPIYTAKNFANPHKIQRNVTDGFQGICILLRAVVSTYIY